jgi:hypothetical protein
MMCDLIHGFLPSARRVVSQPGLTCRAAVPEILGQIVLAAMTPGGAGPRAGTYQFGR